MADAKLDFLDHKFPSSCHYCIHYNIYKHLLWLFFQSWGEIKDNGQISDFLDQLDRFINSLSIAKGNMEGKVQLCEHEHLESMLDSLKTPSDFQQAG